MVSKTNDNVLLYANEYEININTTCEICTENGSKIVGVLRYIGDNILKIQTKDIGTITIMYSVIDEIGVFDSKDTTKFYIARAKAQSLINTIDVFEEAGLTEVEEEKEVYKLKLTDVINACNELDSMLRDELSYAAEDSEED